MIEITTFAGRPVAVFGLARSGLATVAALAAGGAEVWAWDDSEAGRARLSAIGIAPRDLAAADWSRFAALVLAPGVPLTHPVPHWTVGRAKTAGVEVIGDTELFVREIAARGSKARLVAITGTNGKSTTTALTAHLLASAGRPTSLGGNIGEPILSLAPLADDRTYVIEFSSYQIDLTPGLEPAAGALTNITPDHLDRHGTLENYAAVKERMFARQGAGDTAVVGIDDAHCRAIADRVRPAAIVRRVSVLGPVADGTFAADGRLCRMREGVCEAEIDLAGIISLRGAHNWQNAAIAWELVAALGLERNEVAAGMASFPGLAHRMQAVARAGRVLFVNDSKATNADAAAHALKAFPEIFWIIGGRAKEGGIASLLPLLAPVRKVYLVGEAAAMLAAQLPAGLERAMSGTIEAAVGEAARDAAASGLDEPVVLLSPACASFDQFPDFEARGRAFVAASLAVPGAEPIGADQPRGPR
ncbi:MAG: UDP-N-acetylmuramoyl-L-alanine--D-glutamate ligase [Rhizobiales bacterium]|nr:UDP-N-acetylmuramoyl-L-alanine--D-glutamate ligase [Hyphomicrobiales bacterium]